MMIVKDEKAVVSCFNMPSQH